MYLLAWLNMGKQLSAKKQCKNDQRVFFPLHFVLNIIVLRTADRTYYY